MLERAAAVAAARHRVALDSGRHILHQHARLFRIGEQHLDDRLHRHVVVIGMPAVVIGDHGHRRVAHLGLARELGFGHVGHADDVAVPGPIQLGFGQTGELRPLHHQIGAAARHVDADFAHRRLEMVAQAAAHRVRHGNMRHHAGSEKTLRPRKRPVDELVHDDEHAGMQMLAQRAHGADGNDIGHAQPLQRVDVGAEVDLRGRNPVAAPVPWQKYHRLAVELAAQQFVRRPAERRRYLLPALAGEAVDVVDTAAADNAEHLPSMVWAHHCLSLVSAPARKSPRSAGGPPTSPQWVNVAQPEPAAPGSIWCRVEESNLRPSHYECAALPTELTRLSYINANRRISGRPRLYAPTRAQTRQARVVSGKSMAWRPLVARLTSPDGCAR